jgi:hypothetical protein
MLPALAVIGNATVTAAPLSRLKSKLGATLVGLLRTVARTLMFE